MPTLTLDEVMGATDWNLLAKQKRVLAEACDRGWDGLHGLLEWIDAIQDAAEQDGHRVVFIPDYGTNT